MNNKITEEAMINIIRRIEILESQMKVKLKTPKPQIEDNKTASKAQTDYLRSLGGKTWEGMSKQEAGQRIDNALFNKKISKEIKEPVEVDTDNAGLDGELL